MPINPERAVHIRPLGPQGPKLSIGVSGEDDYKRLGEELGKLEAGERKTFEGIKKAALKANLSLVDS